MNPAATQLFQLLATPVPNPIELTPHKQVLHILVNSVFNVDSASADEAQLDGIIFGEKAFSSIPPSSDALHQKALHVAYQVNYIIIHKYVSHML